MREDVRLVEVKCVDHVGVAQRLEEDEIVVIGPVRARGDDGVVRRAFADCGRELGLDAVPAIAVIAAGLVENFEEDAIGVERGPVARERTPEIGEFFDEFVVGCQALFEIVVGVDVDVHRQALIEEHFQRGVKLA